MKNKILIIAFIQILILLFSCREEDKTVSFPTNIFADVKDENGKPLDSAYVCLFDNYNNFINAIASYDSTSALKFAITNNLGKATFQDVESNKQYWIFGFRKFNKIDSNFVKFNITKELGDNFATSNQFSITPQKGTDNNIDITLAKTSGLIVFSFLGQSFNLDSIYNININQFSSTFKPNTTTTSDFYPILIRKNTPFSYMIESKNKPCSWTISDTLITQNLNIINLKPCELIRVGFEFDDDDFIDNVTISGFKINNIAKGNIMQTDDDSPTFDISNTIELFPGNYTINFSVTTDDGQGNLSNGIVIRDLTIIAGSENENLSNSTVRFLKIIFE